MKSLPFIAFVIALIAGFLSLTDWFSLATPFLTGMMVIFLILAIGAAAGRPPRHWS